MSQGQAQERSNDIRKHYRLIIPAIVIILILIFSSMYLYVQFEKWNKGYTALEIVDKANFYAKEWNEGATLTSIMGTSPTGYPGYCKTWTFYYYDGNNRSEMYINSFKLNKLDHESTTNQIQYFYQPDYDLIIDENVIDSNIAMENALLNQSLIKYLGEDRYNPSNFHSIWLSRDDVGFPTWGIGWNHPQDDLDAAIYINGYSGEVLSIRYHY